MSVPVSKRTLSDLEFYHNAFNLRLNITNLLLRDFAIKDKIRNLQVLQGMRGMTDEDTRALGEISERYGFSKPVIERYPEWLINHFSIDFYYLENNILKLYNGIILNKKGRL